MSNYLYLHLNDIEHNVKNGDINNILNFDITHIIEYEIELVEIFILNVIQIIESNNIIKQKNFKRDYFGPVIDLIVRIIKNVPCINLKNFNYSILKTITYYKKGNYFLDMIKDNILKENMKSYEYINIINDACLKGSLLTFLFWYNLNKSENSQSGLVDENNFTTYLLNSISNSDDRILKYILKNSSNFVVEDEYIYQLLSKLFSALHIPQKFKLKRIKLISFKIDLKKYFNSMILICNDIQLILKLAKFYYFDEINFNIFINFFDKFNHFYNYFIEFYKILKTDKEQNIFVLLLYIRTNYDFKLNFSNNSTLFPQDIEKVLIDNYIIVLNSLNNYYLFTLNSISNNVLQFYITNNIISKYLDLIDNKGINTYRYIYYTKFYFNESYGIINLLINKILSKLRCLCKKKYRLKLIKKKILLNPIINEINNYKPNKILKNGSLSYQLNKHNFNFIPPRHLLPQENLNNEYLIKEKADGILVNTLPPNIFPFCIEIINKQIKAEYIEELDLYLVFDINIPNTTILERQLFLRNLHPSTNNISSERGDRGSEADQRPPIGGATAYPNQSISYSKLDDLLIEINKERNILNNFLNSDIKTKWYPKMFWHININKFYPSIIKFIEEQDIETNNKIINVCENKFKNDGFILTPLDGSRELKIKPKSLMTIDLLCNHDLEEFKGCKVNKIYRCYPNSESKFIPKEIRFDKTKSNSIEIINCIKNIYNYNWNNELNYVNDINYYKKPIKINDIYLIKLLENQKKIFINNLMKFDPEYNKNWLDLGCGQCKFYHEIKNKYLPNKYIGMDNDLKTLSKTLKFINEKENIFFPYPVDLNKKWEEFEIKWYNVKDIQFDYIFANYSLSHFFSESFFEQLNKYSKTNTKFLFNLVKSDSNWLHENNYLRTNDDQVFINFDWISYSNIEKIYINLIPEYCKKFGWNIIDKFINYDNDLSKCYYWYLLIKL
jgi:hypothetical protein